jgi:CMP-N-acetylneuraminic acid synthetase
MKIIIPYRENSQRCKKKNTRKFFLNDSLLGITINNFKNQDISLACIPTKTSIKRANDFRVDRIDLSSNTSTGSWGELAVEISQQIDKSDQLIGFAFCTNPVFFKFNSIKNFLLRAKKAVIDGAGSAMVVYPLKHYILDNNMQGINHGQGPWHQYSQHLPQWHINPWFFIVTTASNIIDCKYWYTPDVVPLKASGPCIDIDTEEDFKLAKTIYSLL